MGIDAKKVQLLIGRIIVYSLSTSARFVQKYPLVSGVLFLVFALYIFLPSLFYFLVYSSPFLACTVVFIRFYLKSQSAKIQVVEKNEKKDDGISSIESKSYLDHVGTNEKSSITQNEAILRRNVRGRNEEPGVVVVEKGETVLSESLDGDSVGRATLVDGKSKEIMEEESNGSMDPRVSSFDNVSIDQNIPAIGETSTFEFDEQAAKFDEGGGEAEVENSNTEDEDDDEEEAREGGTKAVEWNEDDQKNLMDLGDSEIERNRRLESLIARRRSRKLYKMNTERISLMDMDGAVPGSVAPVFVSRSNPFDVPDNPEDQIPGSAPSILLPTRNPFDLPYDQFEEKPNLMADSFHQEFMAAHQKDLFFCRHKSFSLGPSFPFLGIQGHHDDQEHLRRRRHPDRGDHDQQEEHFVPHGGELRRTLSVTDLVTEEGDSPNQVAREPEEQIVGSNSHKEISDDKMDNADGIESNATDHQSSESTPSSSSDDNEQTLDARGEGTSGSVHLPIFKFPEMSSDFTATPLPCPIPKARSVLSPPSDSSHLTIDKSRVESNFFHPSRGPWHTPTDSIASDMQVEVSEVGSPPLTVNGSASSSDGESYTYDGDVEKEVTSGSDDMWGVSPHAPAPGVIDHEMFGEVNDIGDYENMYEGFSSAKKELEAPSVSAVSSMSFPNAEVTQVEQISGGAELVVGEVGGNRFPDSSDAVPQENVTGGMLSTQESVDRTPHELHLQEPQQSSSSPVKAAEEINISYDMDDLVQTNDYAEDLKSTEHRNDGSETSARQEASDNPAKTLEIESSNASEKTTPEVNSHNTNETIVQVSSSVEHLKPSEERDGEQSNIPKESTSESSKYAEGGPVRTSEDHAISNSGVVVEGASENLTEGVLNVSVPNNCEESMLVSESNQEEESGREVGASGINHDYRDPIPLEQQEVIVEQVPDHSSSSSSPNSALPDGVPTDFGSSLDFNEHRPTYVSESDVEESAVRKNLLEILLPEQLAPPKPKHASQMIEGSTGIPPTYPRKPTEPSDAVRGLTTEDNQMHGMSASETKEDVQSTDIKTSEKEASSSNEVTAESLKQLEAPVDHVEAALVSATENDAKMKQLEPGEEHDILDHGPESKEEDSTDPSRKPIIETTASHNLGDPSSNEKDYVIELSKPNEIDESLRATDDSTMGKADADKLGEHKIIDEPTITNQ